MASAKFLEEALNSEIDEKAVTALVGSLVTSTPTLAAHQPVQNHRTNSTISNGGTLVQPHSYGIANGGGQNQTQTQDVSKTSTLLSGNVVSSNAVTPQVTVQQQQQQQHHQLQPQNQPTATYMNQVTSNQSVPALAKTHEQVKIIYSSAGQVITTSGAVNTNNKISFPGQTVGQLANGTLGSATVLQTTPNVVTSTGSVKQTGVRMVSVPLSVPVSVGGNTANTTLQGKTGGTIVPSNMQILNMNAIRPGTPAAGQQAGKQVAPRIVIGQPMMGARPGAPVSIFYLVNCHLKFVFVFKSFDFIIIF